MKPLEEVVMEALECPDKELFPYMPYILQDFWELGTNPEVVISLIEKHLKDTETLNVLDLGCGKGPVSVKISAKLQCKCYGIDAIPEFIDFARAKAVEYNVGGLCRFEIGDIREKVKTISGFDVIIAGSIGNVFGDFYKTLTILSRCLNHHGAIVIDHAYSNDDDDFTHPRLLTQQELLRQITSSKMRLVDEIVVERNSEIYEKYDMEYAQLKNRCEELTALYPEKSFLFNRYLELQKSEYEALKSEITCSTMFIKRASD